MRLRPFLLLSAALSSSALLSTCQISADPMNAGAMIGSTVWSAEFSKPSSVAPRYEMRLLDLE